MRTQLTTAYSIKHIEPVNKWEWTDCRVSLMLYPIDNTAIHDAIRCGESMPNARMVFGTSYI